MRVYVCMLRGIGLPSKTVMLLFEDGERHLTLGRVVPC